MSNKIKYGLSNVYYGLLTGRDATTGAYTYGTPVALEGAVNLSLEPDGEIVPVYADNVEAVSLVNNKGYTGELELLIANDAFKVAVLGEELVSGVQFENADAKPKEFALAFQFEGDVNEKRHWLYRCKCSRPKIESSTKGDKTEPVNDTLSITVRPRIGDKQVKASVDNTTDNATIYANWFNAVYEKSAIVAPSLTLTAAAGTATGTTKITIAETLGSGNHFAYKVSSTVTSVPNLGTTITESTVYTSGADISGVDSTTNKYVEVYELNSSNAVVKFGSVTLTSAQIKS